MCLHGLVQEHLTPLKVTICCATVPVSLRECIRYTDSIYLLSKQNVFDYMYNTQKTQTAEVHFIFNSYKLDLHIRPT